MQEALKKVTNTPVESGGRSVTLCLQSQKIFLNGLWTWDMDSPSVYCSDVMHFPKDVEAVKGIIHPDDLPKIISSFLLMVEKEIPRIEFRIITTFGEVKEIVGQRVSISGANTNETLPGNDQLPEAPGQIAKQKEIDLLRLKRELSRSQQELTEKTSLINRAHSILNSMNEACYELDKNGIVVFVNRRVLEWWNLEEQQVIGRNMWDVFPEAVNTQCYSAIQTNALDNKQYSQCDYVSAVLNKWLSLSATPTETGCIVIFRNIDDGKKDAQTILDLKDALREELRWHTQFLETLLDNSINRITVFDINYRFMVWNKSCEEVHGITRDYVIGKTIFEIFPGIENYPLFMDAQERSVKGEYVHISNVQDGFTGAYLELFYVPLKKESGETYAVLNVMNDVSRYVKSSEELNALNKQLEAKNAELEQKNEEITSFAFVASHDMKEPLRKIHTFSDWLMETEKEWMSQQGKTILEKMNASVQRMEALIDDILVLTKIHSDRHKEEDVDLDKILNQVKEEMADSIGQTNTVIEAQKLPVIRGNANQLFYLFKNLVSNAIKFQKPGGIPQITITSEIVNGCEVNLSEREAYLKLSFIDNGFGFDQKYEKKIFQVFQRLHGKQEFEGTGMGLAICKKIMENHEGLINVKSELGKGSVFNCFFPLH